MRRRTLTFGRVAIDAGTRTLTRDGERVDLQQQPFELLMLLVEQADAIVTREAIRARIWPETVIEYDPSINYAVRQIRVALGPEAGRIQTVARRGYRFVGPVRDGRLAQRINRTVVAAAAGLAVAVAIVFSAGVVAAHTPAGAFIYVHIVHPDRCPYIRMLIPSLRNS